MPVEMQFDYSGPERNNKFSVSNLLHVSGKLENLKQEPPMTNEILPAVAAAALQVRRYNPVHKSRIAIVPNTGPNATVMPPVQRGDLINPAVLPPYFTTEMPLRLAPSSAAEGGGGASLPLTHQFYLKQGPSKCESCNIVFCKYENFLAHKKHYCASRPPLQQQNVDADDVDKISPEGSPGSGKPLTVCSPQSSKDSVSPTPMQLKPPMIQFICSMCGVKFSSFDNLTTHQSFYCPNRLTGGGNGGQDLSVEKSLSKFCPKCKVSIPTVII